MLGKIEGKRKGMTEDEMVGWHHRLHGHKFEQALGVGDEDPRRGEVRSMYYLRIISVLLGKTGNFPNLSYGRSHKWLYDQ